MKVVEKLKSIAEKSVRDKVMRFTSLYHLINEEHLLQCFRKLRRSSSPGIDGVKVEEYGLNLDENVRRLVTKLKRKRYRPQALRRVMIPKPHGRAKRSLGIPTVEDKLVQMGLKEILSSIYEGNFLDSSYGFRPGRSCHQAVKRFDNLVMQGYVNYIVKIDIEKFFDRVSHEWLMRCLEVRVKDPNILLLVSKFLKAGVMEASTLQSTEQGTPQGGVISPLLSNIYLHYILDLWFAQKYKSESRGRVEMIRYGDDVLFCCECYSDAMNLMLRIRERFSKFNLKISEEKSVIKRFGRSAWQSYKRRGVKVPTINFLGFTHYCTQSRRGKFILGHRTEKKRLSVSIKSVSKWMKSSRNRYKQKILWTILKAKMIGHYNYFGVSGNMESLKRYYYQVYWMARKWLNRRSQRKSMTIENYSRYVSSHPLPLPRIYHNIYSIT